MPVGLLLVLASVILDRSRGLEGSENNSDHVETFVVIQVVNLHHGGPADLGGGQAPRAGGDQ